MYQKGVMDSYKGIRLGIVGTGRIAKRFVPEARLIERIEIMAVYNPHSESAERYAYENEIDFHTDDLEAFYERVDAVYIASPHQTHYEYTKRMLENGKHVLCEKPLCMEKAQAEELYHFANERKLVLMEAIKTAHCPGFLKLLEVAESGIIGDIKDVEASFTRLTPRDTREFRDTIYGGSFTEFGSYVLLPVMKLLGTKYQKIIFQSLREENGVDGYTKALVVYDSGIATVKTGLAVKSEGQLLISGTQGYILAESPWWLTKKFEVRYEDPIKRDVYTENFEGQGLRYEIESFAKRICEEENRRGIVQEESISMAGIMEEFLRYRKECHNL